MFNRDKYKKFARIQLKNRLQIPVVSTFIYLLICAMINAPELYDQLQGKTAFRTESTGFFMDLCFLLELCILFVAIYAQLTLYLRMSRSPEKVSFSNFLEGFSSWGRAIFAGAWELLWTFIWGFFFIIPGIVKHYSYCMTKFIAIEYPGISVFKAMRISIEITRGHKMDIFMTDVSFVGWWLLGILTGGIGFFWFLPYYFMTMTNVYHALLTEAIETKRIKPEDLTEE